MSGHNVRDQPNWLPKIRARLLLKLALAFSVAVGTWYLVRYPYSRTVASITGPILKIIEGTDADVLVDRGGNLELETQLERNGERLTIPLKDSTLYDPFWNLIVWMALLLMTPWRKIRERWVLVLFLMLTLFALHVGFFTAAMFVLLENAYLARGFPRHSDGLMTLIVSATHIYQTILTPFLPFLLASPLWLLGPKAARKKISNTPVVGRNVPCPCGSGKKYKNCCG